MNTPKETIFFEKYEVLPEKWIAEFANYKDVLLTWCVKQAF